MTESPFIGRNYLKPPENERVPIVVLDFNKMYACWLPGLRYTLYFDEEPQTEELKRIREIILLEVFSTDGKYLIELTAEDFEGFETAYSLFSTYGGEMFFYRRKEGRRMKKYFDFKPKKNTSGPIRKYNAADNIF
ncbi:hypothetical protein [Methanimicrococcus blatticola]|uniref:Uncharacterized protein n=1 Tax=Methanimicrococcus blatticola TaxID=91560 RepID=A0A484F2E6_9EURY|nr:hypothetical protein [Methanimicrococcus blatticola]MBZ3935415.1 hypothetical protein [Methanimicrococcus blatticola]MCC2508487.1 hypothetical protein [Methanimicrococcus blatticola]TDQ67795.1 hypothetical protein C7391_1348 [Methanimicrococcus blatticola]